MARDENRYKEGVDFEWVTAKGSNYKTRRFFTKAEKEAKKSPKAAPKTPKATKAVATKPKEKPVTKDAMKGYRAGDITTSPLIPKAFTGGPSRYSKPNSGADRVRKAASEGIAKAEAKTPVQKVKGTRQMSQSLEDRKKDFGPLVVPQKAEPKSSTGGPARYTFQESSKRKLDKKFEASMSKIPPGMNFTDWKRYMTRAGKLTFKPNEALTLYGKYKQGQ